MDNLVLMLALSLTPADPGLGDLDMFPSTSATWQAYRFRSAHREWVQQQLFQHPFDSQTTGYNEWLQEINCLGDCWEMLWQAHGCLPEKFVGHSASFKEDERARRRKLAHLREMLGDDNYYRGRMPAVVPIWRFREVR